MCATISLPPGGTVARAKRTDRAEARRRYRATLIDDPEFLDDGDVRRRFRVDRRPRARRSGAGARLGDRRLHRPPTASDQASSAPSRRPSARPTFAATSPPCPQLLRHRSFLIPLGDDLVAAAVVIAPPAGPSRSAQPGPYFLAPPPVAPVFLAGFLAPRASYLIGGLLGFISSVRVHPRPVVAGLAAGVPWDDGGDGLLHPDIIASAFVHGSFVGGVLRGRGGLVQALPRPGQSVAGRTGGAVATSRAVNRRAAASAVPRTIAPHRCARRRCSSRADARRPWQFSRDGASRHGRAGGPRPAARAHPRPRRLDERADLASDDVHDRRLPLEIPVDEEEGMAADDAAQARPGVGPERDVDHARSRPRGRGRPCPSRSSGAGG